MSFKITITSNETGEVLLHDNVKAILGGVVTSDGARGIVLTSCPVFEVAECANAAEEAVNAIKAHHPEVHLLVPAIRALTDRKVEDRSPKEAKDDAD